MPSSSPSSLHPSRLIFGSCNSQVHKEQPMWSVIEKRNATAFVWGGDAVYADDRIDTNKSSWFFRRLLDGSPEYLRVLYDQQRQQPGYQSLLRTNISIFGTIDDHDYGKNNGDKTFPWGQDNGKEFVRFLNLPESNSAMIHRAEKGYGVYGVQVFDFSRDHNDRWLSDKEAGLDPDVVPEFHNTNTNTNNEKTKNKRVAVFVLDVRTNKTPWITSFPQRYGTDTKGDFLGEKQWEWFETAIRRSDAAVNIVVTGIQIHAERFYDSSVVENWSGFPAAQHRLHQALLQPNVQSPILISGDVHKAQLLRKDCKRVNNDQSTTTTTTTTAARTIRPLYEITTSGMTHAWGSAKTSTCGRMNTVACNIYYFQAIFRPIMMLAHRIYPWKEILVDDTTGLPHYTIERNVAELEMDWDKGLVNITILGVDDVEMIHQSWSMTDLTSIEQEKSMVPHGDYLKVENKLRDFSIVVNNNNNNNENEWICVHYRGMPNGFIFGVASFFNFSSLFMLTILPFVSFCFVTWIFVIRRFKKPTATKNKKE